MDTYIVLINSQDLTEDNGHFRAKQWENEAACLMEERKFVTVLALCATYVVFKILRQKKVYPPYYTFSFLNDFHPVFKKILFYS